MPRIPKSDFDCTDHALPILHENNLVEEKLHSPEAVLGLQVISSTLRAAKKAIAYIACVISLLYTDDCVCSQTEMIFFSGEAMRLGGESRVKGFIIL